MRNSTIFQGGLDFLADWTDVNGTSPCLPIKGSRRLVKESRASMAVSVETAGQHSVRGHRGQRLGTVVEDCGVGACGDSASCRLCEASGVRIRKAAQVLFRGTSMLKCKICTRLKFCHSLLSRSRNLSARGPLRSCRVRWLLAHCDAGTGGRSCQSCRDKRHRYSPESGLRRFVVALRPPSPQPRPRERHAPPAERASPHWCLGKEYNHIQRSILEKTQCCAFERFPVLRQARRGLVRPSA